MEVTAIAFTNGIPVRIAVNTQCAFIGSTFSIVFEMNVMIRTNIVKASLSISLWTIDPAREFDLRVDVAFSTNKNIMHKHN